MELKSVLTFEKLLLFFLVDPPYYTFIKNEYGNESHFLICGDMNARIADRGDFVPLDISTHMDIRPDDYVCDINLPRSTQDSGFNANGNLLLDFSNDQDFAL